MTSSDASGERAQLMPHQQALIDDFSRPARNRVALLRAEAGMGKSNALVALASQVVSDSASARILFVVSAFLREQYAAILRDRHVRTLLVDRYAFRELIDTVNATWPEGHAFIVGREFVTRNQDVLESLARCRWNLAVIDDVKASNPAWTHLIKVLTPASDRLLVSTAKSVVPSDLFPSAVPTIDWVRESLVDLNGAPLDQVARPDIRVVSFERSPAELAVVQEIRDAISNEPMWIRSAVGRALRSSPASVEAVLQGLLSGGTSTETIDGDDESAILEAPLSAIGRSRISRVLERFDELQEDAKLERLVGLIGELSSTRRICILTDTVASVYSIVTELQDLRRPCVALHSGVSFGDRFLASREFRYGNDSGDVDQRDLRTILVATRYIMTDGGQDTDDLVLYDVPATKLALDEVVGRFDRLGRRTQLTVYKFVGPDDGPV